MSSIKVGDKVVVDDHKDNPSYKGVGEVINVYKNGTLINVRWIKEGKSVMKFFPVDDLTKVKK